MFSCWCKVGRLACTMSLRHFLIKLACLQPELPLTRIPEASEPGKSGMRPGIVKKSPE